MSYAERRQRVLEAIAPGVLVVPSAPLAIRNNDVEHEYRQDSDLYYLTGFDEPDTVLVLSSEHENKVTLFVRPRDPEREVWDGPRAGVEGAVSDFGAAVAHPIGDLAEKLPALLENVRRLYYRLGRSRSFDDRVLAAIARVRARAKLGIGWPLEIVEPTVVLHEMRLYKSSAELRLMEQAVDITREAHVAVMQQARPGLYEYEMEAILRSVFRRRGAERVAYAPIVGSGPNATVLHYRKNDRRMQDGDLLLVDAGAELGYYASDVTRTLPVSGRFGEAQRAIYQLVLDAQLASIEAARPGASLDDVHQTSVRVITEGLLRLGLLQGPLDTALGEERYKPFFMHKTSHWLGMDVHDVGLYFRDGKPRPLEAGMVITVEPGVYIAENADVPAAYRGIGVRIEDDVLVTASGTRVLSESIPKTVEDVERACAG